MAAFDRVPASTAEGSEDGKRGPEQTVADYPGDLGQQLLRKIDPGQGYGRQDTAWAQRPGEARQDLLKR